MKWDVPAELTPAEQRMVQRLRKGAKFARFLREIRPLLFDEAFQAELEVAYERPGGDKSLPPAMLAMALLLQAYEQRSDHDAVEEAEFNMIWQLPLGCLGTQEPPFSQGVLSQFRARMMEH